MAGRPRQNRTTVKGTHLSIRLTEKEIATLDALVAKADADRAQQHARDVEQWEHLATVPRSKRPKPEPSKRATYADIVRALLQQEVQVPRLYENGFWQRFWKDTTALDHLVDLANDREASNRWNREAMLRKLIEEEWKRRRLK